MKIQVSKTMAAFINKMAKAGELHIDHAEMKWFSERSYRLNVGDPFYTEDFGDMDYDDEGNYIFKGIVVVYPDEYYAYNKCITTEMLYEESKRLNVKTEQELKDMLKEMIEI